MSTVRANPIDDSQGGETDGKPSVDLTPEAVERLADDLQFVAAATGPNYAAAIALSAASTLRALSARVAELEAEPHWDDHCVNQFAKMMREKMAASRAKGRSGWADPAKCSVDYLRHLLYEHLDKGDPVDVANFCMMLKHYDASTARDYGNTLDSFKARAEAAEAALATARADAAKAVHAFASENGWHPSNVTELVTRILALTTKEQTDDQ